MIALGNKIRILRKERGLTQEQFASALSISPQAVSKWEMDAGYPDMSMIPILANFFDITLDELFDFDINRKAQKIEDILSEASNYFWDDFDKAEQIYLNGIKNYPSSDKLKSALLSLYTCHIRSKERHDLLPSAEEIAKRFIGELTDVFSVCSTKESLISLYLLQNKYEEAKAVIASLPTMYPYMLNDKMRCSAYHLKGKDRLEGATLWKIIETQELFIACAQVGEGFFEIGNYNEALKSFMEATDIIERFMIPGKTGYEAYPIGGTDTNHMCYYLAIAGCNFKLNNNNECGAAIAKANNIAITSAKDRDASNRSEFFNTFKKSYIGYGLEDFAPFKELVI